MNKITSEQVKKDLEYIFDMAYQRDYKFGETNQSKRIKQYISQLEGQNRQLRKGYEDMLELNLEFNSQLDAIREVCNKDFVSCGYGDLQNIIKQILEGGTK